MAYEYAMWGLVDEADAALAMFPICEPCGPQMAGGASATDAPQGSGGDKALANSILLMRDGLWLLEACHAVATGDIGHVWEILKVSKCM